MNHDWHDLYITDKSGKRMFGRTASPSGTIFELRNLKGLLPIAVRQGLVDAETATIYLDGTPYSGSDSPEIDDDQLLVELGI
jgi:hypothetical protein